MPKRPRGKPWAVIVGIDYGTYGTNFAYHVLPDGPLAGKAGPGADVRLMQNWPGAPFQSVKTRTTALYEG